MARTHLCVHSSMCSNHACDWACDKHFALVYPQAALKHLTRDAARWRCAAAGNLLKALPPLPPVALASAAVRKSGAADKGRGSKTPSAQTEAAKDAGPEDAAELSRLQIELQELRQKLLVRRCC